MKGNVGWMFGTLQHCSGGQQIVSQPASCCCLSLLSHDCHLIVVRNVLYLLYVTML